MRTSTTQQNSYDFLCAKSLAPIPVPNALARRALILSALDPDVLAIEPANEPAIAIVHRATGARALIVHSSPLPFPSNNLSDVPVEILTPRDIAEEPRLSNALAIWANRHNRVGASDQVRILAHLNEAHTTPLIELACSAVSSGDAIAAILALVCRGLVTIDLETDPLGPETRVKRMRSR